MEIQNLTSSWCSLCISVGVTESKSDKQRKNNCKNHSDMEMINTQAGLVTYWSSRKTAEFVACEAQMVKKQHTSAEEQTLTQHLPVCWLSLYSASVTFPLFIFFTSVSGLFLLRSVKFTVVPLLPVDSDRGKQCLFLLGLCNGSHASWTAQWRRRLYTWGPQITAQTDESSVELVLTSWVLHNKTLI